MQKILLAMNALNFNASSIEFATYIANKTRSKVIAVFLDQVESVQAVMTGTVDISPVEERVTVKEAVISTYEDSDENIDLIHTNMQLFKDACAKRNVSCAVHYDKGIALDEILKESRFADLVITDVGTTFDTEKKDGIPSCFVKDLLAAAECPVIISPFEFDEINEIIFTYDGSKSAVFAIKQFTYLFPEFEDKTITLIQILPGTDNELTEKDKLKEWLMMRYNAVHFEIMHGDAEDILFSKFLMKKNKLLVMGAYGRKMFFDHSTADLILKTLDIPVFIAHH